MFQQYNALDYWKIKEICKQEASNKQKDKEN